MRDLTLFETTPGEYLVVACDSDGGIGEKPRDVVRVSAEAVGAFAVRVPLFEVLACGAAPFLVVDCLSVEMEPYGARILAAIREYARGAGLTEDAQFNGSSEENVPTEQTGVGVSVLGLVRVADFFPGCSRAGDVVACAGVPKSGPRYTLSPEDPELLSLAELMAIRRRPLVRDVLPVGSRGVAYEAGELARSAALEYVPDPTPGVDLRQSAGPSTCALFSAPEETVRELTAALTAPVRVIGRLEG